MGRRVRILLQVNRKINIMEDCFSGFPEDQVRLVVFFDFLTIFCRRNSLCYQRVARIRRVSLAFVKYFTRASVELLRRVSVSGVGSP